MYQGVKFRSGADPVLYLSNPPGYSSAARRHFLDDLGKLNELSLQSYQDPEIAWRMNKKHHAGLVVTAKDPDRVKFLLDEYRGHDVRSLKRSMSRQTAKPNVCVAALE